MGNKPIVVIADMNKDFLVYMSTLFTRMNFEVVPIADINGSYDLFRILQPHLILLGCEEGQCAVRETLEALNQDNLLSKVPIIMVGSDEGMAEKCFAAGCSDFLVKPVSLDHLHISLQKCLPNRSGMRKHIRAPFNRNVFFTFAGLDVKSFAITLSEGGLYLRTSKPLPVGSKVNVNIPLNSGVAVAVKGEVAYTMGLLKGQFLVPPGMAIRFIDVDTETIEKLRKEVSDLLIGDIIDEQEESVFRLDED